MFKRKAAPFKADSRQCMRQYRGLSQKVKDPKTVIIWQDNKASKIKQQEIDQDWISRVFGQLSYMEIVIELARCASKFIKKIVPRVF